MTTLRIKLYDIEWDTDIDDYYDEETDDYIFPENVNTLPSDHVAFLECDPEDLGNEENIRFLAESVMNTLSEEYGYCIEGCNFSWEW